MADENKNENTEQNEQNNKTENIKFYSLAPIESDNYDKYKDAFNFALNDSDEKSKKITNIAVTGPYASGKSSVIENVKNKFGSDNFITLSLTNFNSGDMENDNKIQENSITNKKIEEDLEAQLINQLIHKIKPRRIKESRFAGNLKINTESFWYKFFIFDKALALSIFLICGAILLLNDNILNKFFLSKLIDVKQLCIDTIIIMSMIYVPYLSYKFISKFKQKKILRKINIYGNEIELFNNEDNSIFDKYTDEILYLFKNAGVKYFIFEDMDRYEDVTIFKKLREINILLNEKLKREQKKTIKFIYLICDNMFTAEERTKFFDFIIPVVPYIHKGNAYDFMANLFADEIKDERNKKFLIKVSLFIDNSRLIKNIANEYYIYNKFIKLNDREPHTKFIKLLSLIIYKNLFPKDFNQLYFNKGYLAELFNKEEFAKQNEIHLDNLKYKTIKECIDLNEDSNKFFKAPKGYDYIYNGGYFNLIKFLVEDGYIDETYKDYMSAITENYLTYEERAFLQNIAAHNGEQFLLPLERIKEKEYLDNLLTFIDEDDFKRIEILNIYLLNAILYNDYSINEYKIINLDDTYEKYYELIFQQISINKWYDFLFAYAEFFKYELSSQHGKLYAYIYNHYNEIGHHLSNNNNVYIKFVYFTLKVILSNTNVFSNQNLVCFKEGLQKNISNIKRYIINATEFLKILDEYYYNENETVFHIDIKLLPIRYIYNFINILGDIQIIFNDITVLSNLDLFNSILEQKSFQVNFSNIVHILNFLYHNIDITNTNIIFKHIIELQNKQLQSYIFEHFDTFIQTFPNIKQPILIEDDIYEKIISNNNITEKAKDMYKEIFFKRSSIQNIFQQ